MELQQWLFNSGPSNEKGIDIKTRKTRIRKEIIMKDVHLKRVSGSGSKSRSRSRSRNRNRSRSRDRIRGWSRSRSMVKSNEKLVLVLL